MRLIGKFLRDESGSTAIEYGLIASFIALIIISTLKTTGTKLSAKFNAIAGNLS